MSARLAYARECQLLRAAAELLRLPQPVTATSLTFLHRYHRACPEAGPQPQVQLAAALCVCARRFFHMWTSQQDIRCICGATDCDGCS